MSTGGRLACIPSSFPRHVPRYPDPVGRHSVREGNRSSQRLVGQLLGLRRWPPKRPRVGRRSCRRARRGRRRSATLASRWRSRRRIIHGSLSAKAMVRTTTWLMREPVRSYQEHVGEAGGTGTSSRQPQGKGSESSHGGLKGKCGKE
jgi:hypothetical protein